MVNLTTQTTSWKIPDWAYLNRTLSTIYSPAIRFGNRYFKIEFNLDTVDFGIIYCNYNKFNNTLVGRLMIGPNRKVVCSFTNGFDKSVPHYLNYVSYYLPITQFEREFVVDDGLEMIIEFQISYKVESTFFNRASHTIKHTSQFSDLIKRGPNFDFSRYSPAAIHCLLQYIYDNHDIIVPDDLVGEVVELARDLAEPKFLEIVLRNGRKNTSCLMS